MIDFRQMILDRLAELGLSRNWLAEHPAATCSRDAIHRYLAGRSELAATHLASLLEVLRFEPPKPKVLSELAASQLAGGKAGAGCTG